MNSMTGFGRGEAQVHGLRASVECASVNRKQAEILWSGPRELAALEPLVREEVLQRISRGRVTVNATLQPQAESLGTVDLARAKSYARALKALARELELPEGPRLETILAGPGVLKNTSVSEAWPAVRQALRQALGELEQARAREGAALAKVLRSRLTALRRLARAVAPLARRVPQRQREMLMKRLNQAGLALSGDDPRLAAELGLMAERCDVSEELDRINSHLEQFAARLDQPGPIGRMLEFLAQELAREWNTLGAKASDAEISRHVVEAKSLLEQLREQLANVE